MQHASTHPGREQLTQLCAKETAGVLKDRFATRAVRRAAVAARAVHGAARRPWSRRLRCACANGANTARLIRCAVGRHRATWHIACAGTHGHQRACMRPCEVRHAQRRCAALHASICTSMGSTCAQHGASSHQVFDCEITNSPLYWFRVPKVADANAGQFTPSRAG